MFSFSTFHKIPKLLETHSHKKFNFQYHRGVKTLRSKVFRVNHEITMSRNLDTALKNLEIKMPRKFHTIIISYIKVERVHRIKKNGTVRN